MTVSNYAHNMLEIRDGENLWQGSRLDTRLNAFRRSTILQKTIHHHHIIFLSLSKLPARPQKVHEKISGGVQILVASSNRFNITLSEWGSNQKVRHWFRVKCIFKISCRWFFTIFFILENLEKEKPRISCRIWFRGIVRTHWYSGIDSRRVKLKVDED